MAWHEISVKPHTTSKEEINSLLSVVDRDLADAIIPQLSNDRKFAVSYNAVLQLSKSVIACAGYRVVGLGHHRTTFLAVEIAMGESIKPFTSYFEICRRKRNLLDYDKADVATKLETTELLEKALKFKEIVDTWLKKNYPTS